MNLRSSSLLAWSFVGIPLTLFAIAYLSTLSIAGARFDDTWGRYETKTTLIVLSLWLASVCVCIWSGSTALRLAISGSRRRRVFASLIYGIVIALLAPSILQQGACLNTPALSANPRGSFFVVWRFQCLATSGHEPN